MFPNRADLRSDLPDHGLALLAAGGDRTAFGHLVRRHGAQVRLILRRMGADLARADDVAQEAFIAAFRAIADFRGETSFPGWIRAIAIRKYLRFLKSEQRWAQVSAEAALDAGRAILPDPDPGLRRDLDQALQALSEMERISVTLCHGAGFSHKEAATALNLPVGTVKSHVKRGLDKLRARLAPDSLTLRKVG